MRRVLIEYSFFFLLNFLCNFFVTTENENKLGRKSIRWINWCENQKTIYILTNQMYMWRWLTKDFWGAVIFFCVVCMENQQGERQKIQFFVCLFVLTKKRYSMNALIRLAVDKVRFFYVTELQWKFCFYFFFSNLKNSIFVIF